MTTFKTGLQSRTLFTRGGASRFCRREDGSMTVFGIFMLMCMLVVIGIGIDVMRFERQHAHLQYTLDRAVLAAADLDQPLSPQAVVEDYFAKAGLSDALANVQVTDTLGSRTVTASASTDLNTLFMKLTGVDTLDVAALSTAQEAIDSVEISLVLDVSGSMNSYSRLVNLKIAAKDFIDEMFANSEPETVSISIVPYATQVSAPDELFSLLNVTDEHNYSRCINWEADEFNNTTIDTTTEYQRTMHFDPWKTSDGRDNDPAELVVDPVCWDTPGREMILLEDDPTVLKDYIDAMFADGNTSLDVGMKWGAILVDPSFQPLVQSLAHPDVGLIDGHFSNRPVAHTDGETIKVIVLMTDGNNTSQYYIQEDFRTGESNVWWNEVAERYSIYLGLDLDDEDGDDITAEPLFFWPWNETYHNHAYGEGTYEDTVEDRVCRSYRRNGSCRRYRTIETTVIVDEPGSAEVLTYPELWAWTSMKSVAKHIYGPLMGDDAAMDDWYDPIRLYVSTSTKNDRTVEICDAAKDNGTIVFTIGFESPTNPQAPIVRCASSPSHFFDVEGLEITDAFSAIASSIRALRLTQ